MSHGLTCHPELISAPTTRTSRRAFRQPRRPHLAQPSLQLSWHTCRQSCTPQLTIPCAAATATVENVSPASDQLRPEAPLAVGWDALAALAEHPGPATTSPTHDLSPALQHAPPSPSQQPRPTLLLQPHAPSVAARALQARPARPEPRLLTPILPPQSPSAAPSSKSPQLPSLTPPVHHSNTPIAPLSRQLLRRRPKAIKFRRLPPSKLKYQDLPVKVTTLSEDPSVTPPPLLLRHFNRVKRSPYAFNRRLLAAMQHAKYLAPTPVQAHAIPAIARGRDVCATSPTGTGKTGAYLIPVLAQLYKRTRAGGPRHTAYPSALILAPTRELVMQVYEEVGQFIKGSHLKAVALVGGEGMAKQIEELQGGCDLIVATPGRLMDAVYKRRKVHVGQLSVVVVDEADQMLGLGFEPELRRLLSHRELPEGCQTVMVASTLSPELSAVAATFLRPDAVTVTVGSAAGASPLVKHEVVSVAPEQKPAQLAALLTGPGAPAVTAPAPAAPEEVEDAVQQGFSIVFVNKSSEAEKVHAYITGTLGLSACLLHSGLTQALRDEAVQCFRFGVTPVLVATGLAARGMNIPDTVQVVNWDMPWTITEYVHRCGRTGRGGQHGVATTLFNPAVDAPLAAGVVRVMQEVQQEAPDWLVELAEQTPERRALQSRAPKQSTTVDLGHYTWQARQLAQQAAVTPWQDILPSPAPGLTRHSPALAGKVAGAGAGPVPSDEELLAEWEAVITEFRRAEKGAKRKQQAGTPGAPEVAGRNAQAAAVQGIQVQAPVSRRRLGDVPEEDKDEVEAEAHQNSNGGRSSGSKGHLRRNPTPAAHYVPNMTARSQRLFDAFS